MQLRLAFDSAIFGREPSPSRCGFRIDKQFQDRELSTTRPTEVEISWKSPRNYSLRFLPIEVFDFSELQPRI
jgi:hypothetical protein